MPEETTPDPRPDIMERMQRLETDVAAAKGEASWIGMLLTNLVGRLVIAAPQVAGDIREIIDSLLLSMEQRRHESDDLGKAAIDHARSRLEYQFGFLRRLAPEPEQQ